MVLTCCETVYTIEIIEQCSGRQEPQNIQDKPLDYCSQLLSHYKSGENAPPGICEEPDVKVRTRFQVHANQQIVNSTASLLGVIASMNMVTMASH